MDRNHYIVNGLSSETIKTQMRNSLEKIEGVNEVCIDLGRGSVEVIYNPPATTSQIEECIESTGHKIEEKQ